MSATASCTCQREVRALINQTARQRNVPERLAFAAIDAIRAHGGSAAPTTLTAFVVLYGLVTGCDWFAWNYNEEHYTEDPLWCEGLELLLDMASHDGRLGDDAAGDYQVLVPPAERRLPASVLTRLDDLAATLPLHNYPRLVEWVRVADQLRVLHDKLLNRQRSAACWRELLAGMPAQHRAIATLLVSRFGMGDFSLPPLPPGAGRREGR